MEEIPVIYHIKHLTYDWTRVPLETRITRATSKVSLILGIVNGRPLHYHMKIVLLVGGTCVTRINLKS